MKDLYPFLSRSPLFKGIDEPSFCALLHCLNAQRCAYRKDQPIFREGEPIPSMGLVLSGRVHLMRHDLWGNSSLVAELSPPDLFAESAIFAAVKRAPISAYCKEDTQVLFIDYAKLTQTCTNPCIHHTQMIQNMIRILAQKNVNLATKITHLSKRSIKEKVLSYLAQVSEERQSYEFEIPFNRQELADFLAVDRSALSVVLSDLQSEGILKYRKSKFKLASCPKQHL